MLDSAEKSRFQREQYHIWKNNCRNFCEHLITEILCPSDEKHGEFQQTTIKSKTHLALKYLQSLIDEQVWIGNLVTLHPLLGSTAASSHYIKKFGRKAFS